MYIVIDQYRICACTPGRQVNHLVTKKPGGAVISHLTVRLSTYESLSRIEFPSKSGSYLGLRLSMLGAQT